ncbi:MAG: hypothetical protein ACQESD_00380 [Thermoplasmatota archaeon]
MNLKNKKLIAVFVVPVVVIAAVAGYYLYPVEEPLRIEEGFAEIWLEDLPGPGEPAKNYDNVSATATTYINNDSYMKFEVITRETICTERRRITGIELKSDVLLSEDLNPDNFKFTFRLIETENLEDNYGHFQKAYTVTENASFGYEERVSRASHVLNFEVNSNSFEVETHLNWDIWNTSWGYPATLEVTASLGGLSEDVVATVHVHIVGEGEI